MHGGGGVVFQHVGTGHGPERVARRSWQVQGKGDDFCQGLGVAGGDTPAGVAIHDGFCGAAVVRGNHRLAHGLRLDDRAAEGFGLLAGADDDVGQHERGRHVIALAAEAQAVGKAERGGPGLESGTEAAVPHEHADRILALHHGHGTQQGFAAFPAGEPAGQHDDPRAFRQAPGLRQPVHAVAGDKIRVENAGVDAARYQPDAAFRDAQCKQPFGNKLADGDNALAARHHAVVQALARHVL